MKIDKSNWKIVKLVDVFTKKEENDKDNAKNRFDRFLKVNHMDAESLHIKSWASQKNGEEINPTFYKIFRKGQILFPTRNPHLRRTVLADFDGICGEKTLTLEPNEEFLIPEFIPFLFHSESFYAHTTGAIIGSTNPHCRWRDVASYEFLLPPKDQQAELAELLWAIDDVVESEYEVLNKLNINYASEKKNIYESNENKKIVLGESIDILSGFPFKSKLFNKNKDGIPLIRIRDISESKVETFYSGEFNEKYLIKRGDLIVGMDGDFTLNIWDNENALLNQRVLKISLKKDVSPLLFDYLIHFLQLELDRIHRGVGATTVKHLAVSDVRKIKLPIPENNLEIVINKLDLISKNIINLESKISSSKALQKSLINQVF